MSTPDETPVHIPYTVENVRETQTFGPANQLEDVLEVTFKAPTGGVYTVRLPLSQATAAQVDLAIQERLALIIPIHALGPLPHPQNVS